MGGTDFGGQQRPLVSPKLFHELWKPLYSGPTTGCTSTRRWKIFFHSCGVGGDAPRRLRRDGRRHPEPRAVLGGGHGGAETLKATLGRPAGLLGGSRRHPDDHALRHAGTRCGPRSRERLRVLGRDGGFVFCSIHNIQAKTPVENVVAFFEAARGEPIVPRSRARTVIPRSPVPDVRRGICRCRSRTPGDGTGGILTRRPTSRLRNDREDSMSQANLIHQALEQGKGILRLAPNWVPRSFCVPGRRIKLHPDDYYALGGERGGIDERWFSSTTPADNGPLTGANEGLSFSRLRGRWQDRPVSCCATRSRAEGRSSSATGSGTSTSAGRCTPSSSTTRARCRTTSTTATSTPR